MLVNHASIKDLLLHPKKVIDRKQETCSFTPMTETEIEKHSFPAKSRAGLARAASLTPERRSAIAKQAALARYAHEMKPFDSLEVGARFNCNVAPHKGCFRKASTHGAYALLPSGTGQTHIEIPFEGSTRCRLLADKVTPAQDAVANPEIL